MKLFKLPICNAEHYTTTLKHCIKYIGVPIKALKTPLKRCLIESTLSQADIEHIA